VDDRRDDTIKARGPFSVHQTVNEKNYLFKYHLEVYSKISKYLNLNERKWLASFI